MALSSIRYFGKSFIWYGYFILANQTTWFQGSANYYNSYVLIFAQLRYVWHLLKLGQHPLLEKSEIIKPNSTKHEPQCQAMNLYLLKVKTIGSTT